VTFQFTEGVVGFSSSDVTVTDGTITTFSKTDDDTYVATITPSNTNNVLISVAASVATDFAGNNNTSAGPSTVIYSPVSVGNVGTIIEATDAVAEIENLDSGEIRVTLVDSSGTPIPNIAVLFQLNVGTGVTINTAAGTTNASGQYSTTVSSTVAHSPNFAVLFDSDNDSTPDADGTCTIGDGDVTVLITGATPATQDVTCDASGDWTATFDTSAITGGTDVIIVDANQTDPSSNTGNATQATADKDVTPPADPVCTTVPTPANNTTSVTTTCTGVETGAVVTIPNMSCGTEASNEVVCTGTVGVGGGEITVSNDTVTVTDAAGNANTNEDTGLTIDNADPAAVACTFTPSVANTGTSVSATCTGVETNGTVTINGTVCGTESGGSVTCSINAENITDTPSILGFDEAGNSATGTGTFDLDDDAPVVTIATPAEINGATTEATYSVGGACETADGNVTVTITGATPGSQAVACTANAWTASFDTTAIAEGAATIIVDASQTDSAGNTGNATQATAKKDVTNPAVVITAPTKLDNGSITDTTIQVTDAGGITAANVTVAGTTTATTSAFSCTQTDANTVDCTIPKQRT